MTDTEKQLDVLITVQLQDGLVERLADISPQLNIMHRPCRTHTDIKLETWQRAQILYTGSVFPPPDNLPNVEWVQSHFSGVDLVLQQPDIQKNPDIQITSMRGIHATSIAEYVLAFLLMFGQRLPGMMTAQRNKDWEPDRYEKYRPLELRGATVGIVGYGAVGREIARLVKQFGGYILASKRDPRHPQARDHFRIEGTGDPEGQFFDRLYPPQALATMVRDCDFVVVTVPYTEQTAGLYDRHIFEAMKPGSYLINVGRGGVVDEAALYEALSEGHLAGAAFDVFEQEPLPEDSRLWSAPNLFITPHLAGNAPDYNIKAARVFEENLRRYVAGEALLNHVQREHGY